MDGLRVSQGHGPDRQCPSRPACSAEGLSRGLRALGRPHSGDEEGLPSISAARARAASCTPPPASPHRLPREGTVHPHSRVRRSRDLQLKDVFCQKMKYCCILIVCALPFSSVQSLHAVSSLTDSGRGRGSACDSFIDCPHGCSGRAPVTRLASKRCLRPICVFSLSRMNEKHSDAEILVTVSYLNCRASERLRLRVAVLFLNARDQGGRVSEPGEEHSGTGRVCRAWGLRRPRAGKCTVTRRNTGREYTDVRGR